MCCVAVFVYYIIIMLFVCCCTLCIYYDILLILFYVVQDLSIKNKTISTVSVQRGRNELCLEKPGMITACSVHSCNVAATGSLHCHQPTCMYLLNIINVHFLTSWPN